MCFQNVMLDAVHSEKSIEQPGNRKVTREDDLSLRQGHVECSSKRLISTQKSMLVIQFI